MMQSETIVATPDPGAQVRAGLEHIVAGLDAQFMPAGHSLGQLAETMAAVMSGLGMVENALGRDGGVGGAAAQMLGEAAQRLSLVPQNQAERSAQVTQLAELIGRLNIYAAEIERIFAVLDFYAVNLKIVTAGADGFSEFADDMGEKLKLGAREIKAFKAQIAGMRGRLAEMQEIDAILARECERVIPAVPDKIVVQLQELRQRQEWLSTASQGTREVVMRLSERIGTALGAMQIGDSTRQRLEHVLAGCAQYDAAAGDGQDGAFRAHMYGLFGDHLDDLARDFSGDLGDLRQALAELAPDCEQLLGRSRRDEAITQSGQFLQQLAASIADARGVTGQLHHADNKAKEIAEVVLGGVEGLRARAQVIEGLRYDVDYMAINVNIRARREALIGRPVSVIANEIRISSLQLAQVVANISASGSELGAVSGQFDAQFNAAQDGVDDALDAALAIIGQASADAEGAMAAVEQSAKGIGATLERARDQLGVCSELTIELDEMAQGFRDGAGAAGDLPPGHPVYDVMAAMARSYTMQAERVVHNRHLLPGMESLAGVVPVRAAADDDDALFDDALF
jgi:hypothetical protein